ncbi:VOC family protein [Jidongwangia harbinensis]|uniref:VOC family protein n=1 Tax=Jidongwangia harbinensis TaxID=2878561 RepID=UPI001CD99B70|nr:VOC family protein [Jidongwangia harbinensis]MCA2214288.1 VOC family protein [Jidongwangia harbinensis]
MIRLAPVYYTGDMARTGDFLAALGFAVEAEHRKGGWAELAAPSALLCLHTAPGDSGMAGGGTELSFESDEDPDAVAERLTGAGFPDAVVLDENFGRILRVTGPDGTPVQINFSDRSLYRTP